MFGRFQLVDRQRPVALLAPDAIALRSELPAGDAALPQPASYAALVADLLPDEPARLSLASGDVELSGTWDPAGSVVELEVTHDGETVRHRSRRRGVLATAPERLALVLTGVHLTVLSGDTDGWVARARTDLEERPDPVPIRDPDLLDALVARWSGVRRIEGGAFGQVGLRDLRFATEADGTPIRLDGGLLLTATHAGPGFFDTAHTGVWTLDPDTHALDHRADLFFRRPGGREAYGDHSTHLVRDGERWLVATSTWGDFVLPPGVRARRSRSRRGLAPVAPARSRVEVVLAETDADVTTGRHVLDTWPLPLPTKARSVAAWDPHLLRDGGEWIVGFVSARRFFDFHPVIAQGPDLAHLTCRAEAGVRRATEGTTLVRVDGRLVVAASDGADGRPGQRRRYPLLDLDLRDIGGLDAPYGTNIPWPNLAADGDGWLMATFDGTRWPGGAPVVGYGTHGDVVILRAPGLSR